MKRFALALISVLVATSALATPSKPCLYGGKKINALMQRGDTDTSLTSEERSNIESFKEDTATACAIRDKVWPVCISGGGDMARDCASLSAEELKAAPHEAEGARYSVSTEEAMELEKQRQELEVKWADSNSAREVEQ
jgi:hypothetical protein